MVGDRGPNGQIRVEGANRRTFPVPEWTPLIAKVRVEGDRLTIEPIDPARVPDVVAAIVAVGGRVHDVDAGRGSLEDRFVALVTGGTAK